MSLWIQIAAHAVNPDSVSAVKAFGIICILGLAFAAKPQLAVAPRTQFLSGTVVYNHVHQIHFAGYASWKSKKLDFTGIYKQVSSEDGDFSV